MSSSLLIKKGKSVCVIKQKPPKQNLVYNLEGMEKYGFKFYSRFHKFEFSLNKDKDLLDCPYNLLNSCVDLSGRVIGTPAGMERKKIISGSGKNIIILKSPIYSLSKELNEQELKIFLNDYSKEKKDFPYASISTSAYAIGDAGDDFYLNTLFFMTKGYGLLTKISAVAGRDIEDCCSPEFYYETYKVKLKNNPLKQIQEKDIIKEANLVELKLSSNPKIINPIEIKPNNNSQKLDKIIDELFITLRPDNYLI